VALGFAPCIGAAQALGGDRECPRVTWRMGHGKGPNYLGSEADLIVLGPTLYTQLNGFDVTQFYWVLMKDFKYFNFYYN
jgi:hypothetical protein